MSNAYLVLTQTTTFNTTAVNRALSFSNRGSLEIIVFSPFKLWIYKKLNEYKTHYTKPFKLWIYKKLNEYKTHYT